MANLEKRYFHEGRVVSPNFENMSHIRAKFESIGFDCLLDIYEQIIPRFVLEFYGQLTFTYNSEGQFVLNFVIQNKSFSLTLEEFGQILKIPFKGQASNTEMWSLDHLSVSVPSRGLYKTKPPSPRVIKSLIQVPRQGQETRTKNKKTIVVEGWIMGYETLGHEEMEYWICTVITTCGNIVLNGKQQGNKTGRDLKGKYYDTSSVLITWLILHHLDDAQGTYWQCLLVSKPVFGGEDVEEKRSACKSIMMIAGDEDDAATGDDAVNVSGDVSDAAAEFALMGLSSQVKLEKMNDQVKLEESKASLGYGETFGSDEVFDPSAPSIFDTTPEDVVGKPLYDRFVKAVGMHVVPSPITGTFMPPSNKPDLDLYSGYICDKSSDSETTGFASCVSSVKSSSSKTNEHLASASSSVDFKIVSKTADQKPSSTIDDPSFSFKENVKTPRNICNKSGINNRSHCKINSFGSKTCFVCGSKFHLIKDCDFYEKQLGLYNKPMWNNVANIPSFVPRAASVPAWLSRNQPASVTAGSAFPAGSRNRPATVSADRHVPAGSSTRPAPVSAGLAVITNCIWMREDGELLLRPQQVVLGKLKGHICNGDPRTMENPHKNKDLGIVDSGCSRSMTGNKEKLDDFVKIIGGTVTFGGGDGKITGKGTIRTSKLNFENVYYVEELQNFNLFSVSQICDKKNKVLFTDTECLVLTKEFHLHWVLLQQRVACPRGYDFGKRLYSNPAVDDLPKIIRLASPRVNGYLVKASSNPLLFFDSPLPGVNTPWDVMRIVCHPELMDIMLLRWFFDAASSMLLVRGDLDNSTSNVLIPLDSWTSGLLVYKLPLSVEYGVSTSIGYGVSSSLSNTAYSSQQINTAYPLPLDTAYPIVVHDKELYERNLFTPYQKNSDREFRSSRRHFKDSKSDTIDEVSSTYLTEMQETDADAKTAIQEMAEYSQKWHNGTSRGRSNDTFDGLATIQTQLNNLGREIKKVNENVYAAQVGCEQCKGPHYTKDFPLKEEGKTLEEAYYTQFGGPFQGGGYRATASGYYQRNNANPSY
ncbi:hypothetical protein Tco_0290086 [Tanacetum coccineum]